MTMTSLVYLMMMPSYLSRTLTLRSQVPTNNILQTSALFSLLALSFLSLRASHLCHHRSWLTMHNYEIYYLSAVNYYPVTILQILFSSGSKFTLGQGRGFPANFLNHLFYQVCCLTLQYLQRSLLGLIAHFTTHLFYLGHYLTYGFTPQNQQMSLFTLIK